jgi:AraC-type DNA-binding domain-containing proteins
MAFINQLKGNDFFSEDIPIFMNIVSELEYRGEFKHKHDFIEIAYVSSGKGIHSVGDEQYEISKGDLSIINYDIPHVFLRDPMDKQGDLVIYNCIFKPEFLDYSLINSNDFKDIANYLMFNTFFIEKKPDISLKLSGTHQAEIEDIYRKMQAEFFSKQKGYINILRSCLIEMLTKIFRYLESEDTQHIEGNHKKMDIISKAFDFLKENYNSSELNINEVAVRTFLSRSYFSRLFKEVTGQNFTAYLQNLRISEACTLLKTTDKKVVEILSDVGFKDIKYFNQLFKKITGRTPGEYRKSG